MGILSFAAYYVVKESVYRMKMRLSNVTKAYLETYNRILENMICNMTRANLTNSISHNFIVQMLSHHRAAIQMCENLLQYTTNLELQDICCNIIEEQTRSIANMERVLSSCSRCRNSNADLRNYQCRMDAIKQNMFDCMGNAPATNSINIDFLQEMIPHHRGAVEMCETTLQYDICNALVPILEAIITSQKRGIRQMEQLLRELENCCES